VTQVPNCYLYTGHNDLDINCSWRSLISVWYLSYIAGYNYNAFVY